MATERPILPHVVREGQLVSGRYRVEGCLGSGSMGTVYRARDEEVGMLVAVKLLKPHLLSNDSSLLRLRNELLVARTLHHRNLVRTYTFEVSEEGIPFIVMELVEGVSLEALLTAQPGNKLPADETARILHDIASGLAHAHESGVIHRDIKPQNILLTADGVCKIADFGLARHSFDEQDLTKTGSSVGTPYYMAPEQFRGEPATFAIDIYSLGIVGYEMLTGSHPFESSVFFSLALQHISDPLPDLRAANVPDWLADLIARCAAKNPSHRYLSMCEVAAILSTHFSVESREEWQAARDNSRRHQIAQFIRQRLRRASRSLFLWVGILFSCHLTFFGITRINHWVEAKLSTLVLIADSHLPWFVLAPTKYLLGYAQVDPRSSQQLVDAACGTSNSGINAGLAEMLSITVPDVNARSANGDAPLHCTLRYDGQLAHYLLTRGADINIRGARGKTPVQIEMLSKDAVVLKEMLPYARLDFADDDGNNSLHDAVTFEYLEGMRMLLASRPPLAVINARNRFLDTPLLLAIRNGSVSSSQIVALLLAANADPMIRDRFGVLPLALAAHFGQVETVNLLLRYVSAAEANDGDLYGKTPLMYAVDGESFENVQLKIAKALLEAGADVNSKTTDGATVFDFLRDSGQDSQVGKLLESWRPVDEVGLGLK